MRIEKLNSNKIKVTVSASDLINLDIDIDDLSPNSETLHSFLFHVMETIHAETGFNPYNGQVVVEATPSREGMSIVVSKVRGEKPQITREDIKKGVSVRARKKQPETEAIFCFDDFDDLCAALCVLYDTELASSEVYKLSENFYFVIKTPSENIRCVSIMKEFALSGVQRSLRRTYLKEHGSLIAAGDELITMTENIRSLT